jgi:autotransporter-associated beta strand protein
MVAFLLGGFGRRVRVASDSKSVSSVSPLTRKGLRQRLALLCSVSAIAIGAAGSAHAGQLAASAFQTYDPTTASSIVPGTFALFAVPVDSLHPTQLNEGLTEVGKKTAGFDLLAPSMLQSNLLTDIEPVVIGPGGQLYLTDGHHTFTALENSSYGSSNPTVFVNVIANYSNLTTSQFFAMLQSQNLLLPLNDGVPQAVNTATGAPIPSSLTGLTSDPYRGLEYSILKNKSSKLFTSASNITGSVGASTPGLDKMTGFYSDFLEAAAYRGANNGLGLPYLSPGDIAIVTKWNLTASSQTSLPNIGSVTAAQLPGFILSNNIVLSGVISNSTLANGAVDGNGTFTGITTLNAGTAAAPITIGTPNVGFIMQLGNDAGKSVTLSGANTYTGGTSILAGNLIVAGDSSLGAAVPAGAAVDPSNVRASVQAANGIIFNSLDEGNGTLTLGTAAGNGTATFSTARPIAVGGETATINLNGYVTTLTGQLVSLGTDGVGIGNATGVSDLTIDDNSANKGILILSTASPDFFGNIIIGGSHKPTVRVMDDAALGNTTGPAVSIGQVELNGGTLQAGASFAAPERNLFLGSGSTFDVNGFTTSWGSLTDVQRNLTVTNSAAGSSGSVAFSSLNLSSAAEITVDKGAGTSTSLTFTNGITRTGDATLLLAAATGSALQSSAKIISSGPSTTLTNGIVAPWIITDAGSSVNNAYDFATYGANGYAAFTGYTTSLNPSGTTSVVKTADKAGTVALTANRTFYALDLSRGETINGTFAINIGDGTDPAGLILNGTNGNALTINTSSINFGASEGIIYVGGSQTSAVANKVNAQIIGSGGLTLSGSGMLTLGTATAETGQITINSGTLNLAAADALLTSAGGVLLEDTKGLAAANLAFNQSQTLSALNSAGTNSSVIIDSTGAGGGSTLTKLTIGDGQNLNSTLSSAIVQGAATTDATTIAGGTFTASGTAVSGIITKNGTGLLDLSGMSSGTLDLVSGSTVIVNGGELRIASNIFANPNGIVLNNASELQFAQNGGGQFANAISGTGVVHLIGGTLQLTGSNSYSGGTVVEVGSTLDLTTANVSSTNANIANAGGLIVFDQTSVGTYSGVISDARQMEASTGPLLSGSLVKDDSTGASAGNVTLGAVQAYSGGTFIEAGTLTLGVANAIAGSSGVDLGRVGGSTATQIANATPNTATLALLANNTIQGLMDEAGNTTAVQLNNNILTLNIASGGVFSFGGVIGGTGGLVMTGGGAEFLNGASTYTGATTVNGGLLSVNGSIASSSLTTVNAGGALGGTGFVGNITVNGGMLAPGNNTTGAIGTLTVSGNLAFTTAAQYLVQVSQASSSLAKVSGSAALAGTVQVVSADGSYKFNQPYTILTAAGGLGGTTFNSLALPNFITGALSYTPTNASLTLALALERTGGQNVNQMAVSRAIDRAVNASGSLPAGFGGLLNLPPAALPGALSQLSGELGTGSQQATFGAMTQFVDSLLDHLTDGNDAAPAVPGASHFADDSAGSNAYASSRTLRSNSERDAFAAMYTKAPLRSFDPLAQHWSVWASGFGGSQTTDGNASLGSNSATSRFYGTAVGADYWISPFTTAGFALAGGGTNFSVNGSGTGRSDLFQAGAFIKHTVGAAYVSGALAYGWQDITTDRTVTVAGIDQLQARFNANAFSGRAEGGYRFATPWMGVTPYAAGQFTTFELPAYAEGVLSGASAFAMAYGAASVTDTRSEIGLRTDKSFALSNAVLTLRSRFAWAHDFNPDRNVAATFQALPGSSFVVNGAAQAPDSALTTASAEMKWMNGWSAAATFEGEFSDVTRSYAGKGVVRYTW